MSPRRVTEEAGGNKVGMTALLLVVAAVGMMLLIRAQPSPQPFDPRSESGTGTRGLVVLLEQQGAAVDIVHSVPSGESGGRVLVLQDRLNDGQRRDLLAFVEAGGIAIVADHDSTLISSLRTSGTISGELPSNLNDDNSVDPQINVPLATCDVGSLDHLRGVYSPDGVRFVTQGADRGCFQNTNGAFVLVHAQGKGFIVQLGDNRPFTNEYLRYADNGPLATALLAPSGDSRVSILLGAKAPKTVADIGTGDKTLSDLVRPGVWMAIAQLALAFIVFAIARAIRPGRPVREPEQVPIAGSELVVATGNLMQRARHAERAGWLLRGNLYRSLCRQYHLPPTATIDAVDAAVSSRTNLPPGHVAAVLQREVQDNNGLVQLSNSLEGIREVALAGRGEGVE